MTYLEDVFCNNRRLMVPFISVFSCYGTPWNNLDLILHLKLFNWVLIFLIFKHLLIQLTSAVALLPTKFKEIICVPKSQASCIAMTIDILSFAMIPKHLERIYLVFSCCLKASSLSQDYHTDSLCTWRRYTEHSGDLFIPFWSQFAKYVD